MPKSDGYQRLIQEQREVDAAGPSEGEEGSPTGYPPPSGAELPGGLADPGRSRWDGGAFLGVAFGLAGMGLIAMILAIFWLPALLRAWGWTSTPIANAIAAAVSIFGLVLGVAVWRRLSAR